MPFLRCRCGTFTIFKTNGHYKCSSCPVHPCRACGDHTSRDHFCKYCERKCEQCEQDAVFVTPDATHFYCHDHINEAQCCNFEHCGVAIYGPRMLYGVDLCEGCIPLKRPKCVRCVQHRPVEEMISGVCVQCQVPCKFCKSNSVEPICPMCEGTVPTCIKCDLHTTDTAEGVPMCDTCSNACYICGHASIAEVCNHCIMTVPPCVKCTRHTNLVIEGESVCSRCIRLCDDCASPYKINNENAPQVCKSCLAKYKPCTSCAELTRNNYQGTSVCMRCIENCHKCNLKFINYDGATSKSTEPLCKMCLTQYNQCEVCLLLTLNSHDGHNVHERCLTYCSRVSCTHKVMRIPSNTVRDLSLYSCKPCKRDHLKDCMVCKKKTFHKTDRTPVCDECLTQCYKCKKRGVFQRHFGYQQMGVRSKRILCQDCVESSHHCKKCKVHSHDQVDGLTDCYKCAPICRGFQCGGKTNLGYCLTCQEKLRKCIHCCKMTTRRHQGNTVCKGCVVKYKHCSSCEHESSEKYYRGRCPRCIIRFEPCEHCGVLNCKKRHNVRGECIACGNKVESVSNCPDAKCRKENVWCLACYRKNYIAQGKVQKCLGCAKRVYHDELLTRHQYIELVQKSKRMCSIRCNKCHEEPSFLSTAKSGHIVNGNVEELDKKGVKPEQVASIELRAWLVRLQLRKRKYVRPTCGCMTTMCMICMTAVDGFKYDALGNPLFDADQRERLRHSKDDHVCRKSLKLGNIRKCPNLACGVMIEKLDGCSSINCFACGHNFNFREAERA